MIRLGIDEEHCFFAEKRSAMFDTLSICSIVVALAIQRRHLSRREMPVVDQGRCRVAFDSRTPHSRIGVVF